MSAVDHALRVAPVTRLGSLAGRIAPQLVLTLLGLGAWAYGVTQLRPGAIGDYGLLASANAFFILGVAALMAGFIVELARSSPRGWLLTLNLVGLIVAIHATIPIVYEEMIPRCL